MRRKRPNCGWWSPCDLRPTSRLFTGCGIEPIHRCRHAYVTELLRSRTNVRVSSEPYATPLESTQIYQASMRTSGSRRSTSCRSKGIHTSCTVVDIEQERPPAPSSMFSSSEATHRAQAIQISTNLRIRRRAPSSTEAEPEQNGHTCRADRGSDVHSDAQILGDHRKQGRPHPAAARASLAARPASAVPRRARRFAARSVGPICSATWVAWARRQPRIAKAPRRAPSSNEDGVRVRAATGHPASVCGSFCDTAEGDWPRHQ